MAIASGHLVLTLDATAFGNQISEGLFGANGDASGLATVIWPQVDMQFSSPTGGIGQLAGLPVLVISVPVLPSAAGRTIAVTASSPDSSLSIASGSVTVQGTMSVQKIPAGMGVLAAGTTVPVFGTGFTPSTAVAIDGVEVASARFVSAQEIDVTLGGAAELVGKLARVTDGGVEFDYFCFQPNDPVNFPENTRFGEAVASVQPLFPLVASTAMQGFSGYTGGVVEVQNPNLSAVTVNLTNMHFCCGPRITQWPTQTVSIPAGSWAILDGMPDSAFALTAALPVRVVSMGFCVSVALPVCQTVPTPVDPGAILGSAPPVLAPPSLAITWQRGTPKPAVRTVAVPGASGTAFVAKTATGGSWLSVSESSATTSDYTIDVSVDPTQLAAGIYQGSIVVQQLYGPSEGAPAVLPVTLTVTDSVVPAISAAPSTLAFTVAASNATSYSQTITVTSDSGPAEFSVIPQPGTWVRVSPLSGTTPATLTVTWDPAVTSQIYYQQRSTPASILISGPRNTITVPATFNVTGVQTFQTYLGISGTGPSGLIFSGQTGSPPQTQTINVDPAGVLSATADQPWMSVSAPTTGMGANQTVMVTVNPASLEAGVYHGTVTISESGIAPIVVPVTFGVWTDPPPLTVSPGEFIFLQTIGESTPPFQISDVESGGVPVPLMISIGGTWLVAVDRYSAPTPAELSVGVVSAPKMPGQYNGSFTVESPGRSAYVPVKLLVEPGQVAPPVLSQAVNAASGIAGGVSPGEILSIRGYSAGAAEVGGLKLDASGLVVSSLNGLQVTFDGKAAPLIYTSANQTNLIVPYEVASKTSTEMRVTYEASYGTMRTAVWTLPVVKSAPGIFTQDATGTGPASVLNQDGSVNSSAKPAPRGSVISIFATGEGQTAPAGVTGTVTQSDTTIPLLPVKVTIGGMEAMVQYAGSAPDEVAGVLQVNAVVPAALDPGSAVPLTVTVGGVASQAGVTIAVK